MTKVVACVSCVVLFMITTSLSQKCYSVVEKGKPAVFRCFLDENVTTITWRMLNGTTINNLTTCNFATNTCTDLYAPADYKGFIVPPASGKTMALNITSAKANEVEFKCFSDSGYESTPCKTVVYETSTIVETGQPTTLQCAIPSSATSITWQLFRAGTFINLTTCTVANKVCFDNRPGSFKGSISSSGNENKLNLNVISASTNETVFACLTDKGDKSSNFRLEVSDQACYRSVEMGKPAVFRCFLGENVTTLTWRLLNGTTINNLTTCNFATNTCTDLYAPADYKGSIVPPASRKKMTLNITSAPENEVEFDCFSDTGEETVTCKTVVYETGIIVEKGQPTTLQCAIPSSATSITWQGFRAGTFINLTTCTVANKVCVDNRPTSYKGSISSSGNENKLNLNVISASIDETVFACLTDKGDKSSNFGLQVYALPSKPRCTQSTVSSSVESSSYVDYKCTSDNVYPGVRAFFRRRVIDFTNDDIDPLSRKCDSSYYGSGTDGGSSVLCQYRVPIHKVIYGYGVYVEMFATFSGSVMVNRPASVSDDIKPIITIPQVEIRNCPVGPAVIGDVIHIGTQANCTCELTSQGFPPGTAQWRTPDKKPVGVPTTDGSSILMLTYNPSDPSPTYQCWPNPPFQATLYYHTFKAKFTSIPQVRIRNCPVGPGVIGDAIRIGTQANCTCELTSQGLPPGTAQWRTPDNETVGVPTRDGSSILMLTYNASDPSPTYQCWPNPPFQATVSYYTFTAKFISSAPPSGITGLQVVVIALGVLSSLITSHVP